MKKRTILKYSFLLSLSMLISCNKTSDNSHNSSQQVITQPVTLTPVDTTPTVSKAAQPDTPKKIPIEDTTLTFDITGIPKETIKSKVKILFNGDYHAGEVWQGAERMTWYGVFREGSDYSIRRVDLKTQSSHDALLDETNEKTGIRVYADSIAPEFYVAGLNKVREGKQPTINSHGIQPLSELIKDFLYPGQNSHFSLEKYEHEYSITAFGSFLPSTYVPTGCFINYKIVLSKKDGNTYLSQVFNWGNIYIYEKQVGILWAGDLDGDNELDLLLSTSDHYNVSTSVLYLSSYAKKGELFKAVAIFTSTGC